MHSIFGVVEPGVIILVTISVSICKHIQHIAKQNWTKDAPFYDSSTHISTKLYGRTRELPPPSRVGGYM